LGYFNAKILGIPPLTDALTETRVLLLRGYQQTVTTRSNTSCYLYFNYKTLWGPIARRKIHDSTSDVHAPTPCQNIRPISL